MRLAFPIFIVSATSDLSFSQTWHLALENPNDYSSRLDVHHADISAFGGVFLLLVFLNFILDEEKDIHWLHWIESRLASLVNINSVAVVVALSVLFLSLSLVEPEKKFDVVIAGLVGILVYLGVDVLSSLLESEEENDLPVSDLVHKGSIGSFLFLEVLDASF